MNFNKQTYTPKYLLCFLTTLLLIVPFLTEARTVVRSGDTVSIGQDQLIEGDFYTAGNIINISGEIEEDLLAAGAEITINGQVGEDVLIAGGSVDVHGAIGDDLRIVGGDIIIAEPVFGDVFVVAGTVRILSSASITGDLTIVAGSVEVAGPVEGRVFGWVEELRIDNIVGGEVDVSALTLTLGDNANVVGDIKYTSQNQLVRSQSATIGGEITRSDPVDESEEAGLIALVMPLLVLLFSVALWYLISRRALQKIVDRSLEPGVKRVLLGSFVLLFAPLAISVMLVSMLGTLAGVILLALYMMSITLTIVALPAVIAQFVYSIVQSENNMISLLTLLVGTLLVGVCLVVPFVGPVILIGFFVLTFGALIDLLLQSNQ